MELIAIDVIALMVDSIDVVKNGLLKLSDFLFELMNRK